MQILTYLLIGAAIGQIAIAFINLRLDRLLKWTDDLARLPLLLREVFTVHKWFITITLLIFGAVTLRFPNEFTSGDNGVARWLAAGIGTFWAIRTGIQWLYYDHSHWQGKPGRTAIHWTLTIAYGGCAAVYLIAAFR
jgi:hypothetical protein